MNPHKRKGANPRYAVTSSQGQCIQQEVGSASGFLSGAYERSINESGTHMAPGEPAANDVFGLPTRISIPSSLNLDLSYLNLGKKKDADGCLIADQLHAIGAMCHFGPDSYLKANRRERCQHHLNHFFSISCLFKRKPE